MPQYPAISDEERIAKVREFQRQAALEAKANPPQADPNYPEPQYPPIATQVQADTYSFPQLPVPAPVQDIGPGLAEQYPYLEAAKLTQQAQPRPDPTAGMKGWQRLLTKGMTGAAQGAMHATDEGGFNAWNEREQARERQRQNDLLARAKELRGEGFQQQTAYHAGQEQQLNREEIQRQHNEIMRHQAATEAQARATQEETQYQWQPLTENQQAGFVSKPFQGPPSFTPEGPLPSGPKPPNLQHVVIKDGVGSTGLSIWGVNPQNMKKVERIGDAPLTGSGEGTTIVQGQDEEGKPVFMRIAKAGAPGAVADPQGNPMRPKAPQAPVLLKNQVNAAHLTNKMIGVVREFVQKKPHLIGPIAGNANEIAQGIGTNPFQGTADETDAATLAGHLAYLFLNEARAALPGRPAKEMYAYVKKRSAQMGQDPNILEGFLRSAENNASFVIEEGRQAGYELRDSTQQEETMVVNGITYTKGPDQQWHKK
jgi:hypothetical protein